MSHCVPDFEMDEEYPITIPTSSSSSPSLINTNRPFKRPAAAGEEEIVELLWQNGQVVLQRQNQRSPKKSPNGEGGGGGEGEAEIPAQQLLQSTAREIRSLENENLISHHHHHHHQPHQQQQQLFMQEDEMASWLHYPLDYSSFDRDIYSDLLYPPPPPSVPITTSTSTTTTPSTPAREIRTVVTEIRPLAPPPAGASLAMPPRPPIPPPPPPSKRTDAIEGAPKIQNFVHFSRLPKGRNESGGPSGSSKDAREWTVVESNETPTVGPESRAADSTAQVSGGNAGCETRSCTLAAGTSTTARDLTTACELTVTSSPGGSGSSVSASAEPQPQLTAATISKPSTSAPDDRKRKGREPDETEGHSGDNEIESADAKRQAHVSTATKRSRAAEVHNLSERRRRDRINEKMRALQELIPRCNKSDKASMLDEAIEYLKSLQLQVQMMSMGCGMFPMMYPGVQHYMPAMGMGMGMNMGMDMGLSRPMMPYQSLMPGSGMPNPAVAANMGPRFPMPAFHMQPVPVPDTSRIQASNQLDPMLNSLVAPNPNQPRIPNFVDPYQQFIGLHQAQIPLPQNQMAVQPNKPSSSRDVGNPENHQSG